MNTLGEKIKKLRIENKLTQQELASQLFVSDKTISSWEKNRTSPEINMLLSICSIFNINFYSLIDSNYCNNLPLEIEVKLKVSKEEYERLYNNIKNKSKEITTLNQIDRYYIPVNQKFNDEWLKIRSENNKHILNYKKRIDNNICDEYESLFDNLKNLECILNNLGYKEKGIINKKRTRILYKEKYEFAFDYLENIGYFIEIEVKLKVSKDEYERLLNELNIDLKLIDNKRYYDYI